MHLLDEYASDSIKVECQDISSYVDVKKPPKWFKECQPLDHTVNKYVVVENSLIIDKATMQDGGNYTCEVSFEHNGTEFTISRTVQLTVNEPTAGILPSILMPSNNVIEVELGSPISLACKVTFSGDILGPVWIYSNTQLGTYYNDDNKHEFIETDVKDTQDGLTITLRTLTLNFTEVKEEDYNRKFYCEVLSKNKPKAYVMLKRPDPNFQDFLIALFVSLILVVAVVILTIKMFKVDFVLWYRSSCFAQINTKDGKIYDAYIMYPKSKKANSHCAMELFVLKEGKLPWDLRDAIIVTLYKKKGEKQLKDKYREQNNRLYVTFINLTKAFNTISRKGPWQILERIGCPPKFFNMIIQLHEDQGSQHSSAANYILLHRGCRAIWSRTVVDVVNETISKSRRLIIILENTSNENDFEQQIAMYDALIRNKVKVILIELEKITDYTNMPESIKYIKQKQGVVHWTGTFTEAALSPKTMFWKNIRYQMPPTQGLYLQHIHNNRTHLESTESHC
ncbi:interleukin-1 receptor-like 2 [Discoglossus pictus]